MEIRWLIFYVIEPFKSGSILNYQIQRYQEDRRHVETAVKIDDLVPQDHLVFSAK